MSEPLSRIRNGLENAAGRIRARLRAERFIDPAYPTRPLELHRTAIGDFYLPADARSDVIADAMRLGKVFEPEVVDAARTYVRPGSTVLDVGSNFGQMALSFAEMVGPSGTVHAFEADDFIHAILRRNIEANHATQVETHLAAVYDRSKSSLLYPTPDFKQFKSYGSYGIDPAATSGRAVPTIAIDDLAIDTPISFMKVDVQGCDLHVLRGAADTIRRWKMPICFEYEEQFQKSFGTCFQDYVDFVASIGYRFDRTIYAINYIIVPR